MLVLMRSRPLNVPSKMLLATSIVSSTTIRSLVATFAVPRCRSQKPI